MKAFNIRWDTDGDNVNLPDTMEIPDYIDPDDDDEISDYLTDETGYCHFGYELEYDD